MFRCLWLAFLDGGGDFHVWLRNGMVDMMELRMERSHGGWIFYDSAG